MAVDPLELRLVSALQRFQTLQRQAQSHRDKGPVLTRTLEELHAALEELRLAEERLLDQRRRIEQLQAELRDQQAKYWELLDEIPDPCLVTEPDTTILEVNRAAVDLLNVSQRYLVGKPLSVFVCEDRARPRRERTARPEPELRGSAPESPTPRTRTARPSRSRPRRWHTPPMDSSGACSGFRLIEFSPKRVVVDRSRSETHDIYCPIGSCRVLCRFLA